MTCQSQIELKRYSLRHMSDWLAQVNDPDVCLGLNHAYPVTVFDAIVESIASIVNNARGISYLYTLDADGVFVGSCGIREISGPDESASISYWVAKAYWNRGFATSAVRSLATIGREDLRLRYLFARCHSDNTASQAVLRKCDYVQVGQQTFTERATGRRAVILIFCREL